MPCRKDAMGCQNSLQQITVTLLSWLAQGKNSPIWWWTLSRTVADPSSLPTAATTKYTWKLYHAYGKKKKKKSFSHMTASCAENYEPPRTRVRYHTCGKRNILPPCDSRSHWLFLPSLHQPRLHPIKPTSECSVRGRYSPLHSPLVFISSPLLWTTTRPVTPLKKSM